MLIAKFRKQKRSQAKSQSTIFLAHTHFLTLNDLFLFGTQLNYLIILSSPFVCRDGVHIASSLDTWLHIETPVNTIHSSRACHNDRFLWPTVGTLHKILCDIAGYIYVCRKLMACHRSPHKLEHLQYMAVIKLNEITLDKIIINNNWN